MARVIDIAGLAGAYATRLFAEEGHEVIRIEDSAGDALRRLPPFLGEKQDLEHGAYHQFLNAGKKSLTLNLDSPPAQRIFLELLSQSHALISGDSLPLEDHALFAANPKLVVTRIHDQEPELCAVARSGLMSLTGHPGQAPMVLGAHVPSLAVGIYVAVATAAALLSLKSTGKGTITKVSVREALESFAEQAMVEYSFSGTVTERRGSKGAITAVSGALPCKDGHWVISQIHRPGRWTKFIDWVQDPELISDTSLAEEKNQHKRRDFILDRLDKWAKRFTKTELVEEAQRRHFPASPVSTPLDLIDDPQLIARGFLKEIDHPEFGRIKFPEGAIASLLGTELTPAPRLGEHNTEILTQLGYSETDRQALISAGTV
ncbi:MAG TPA: CaiB/BaiF CoA-transferase family protein [Candidatus Binatia bacterium]|jgi:crotonobetainyl-CoA:carnitine CoA-transferase CaiB-like acyl-CoA transferase